jgi:hypothetical protein
MVGRDAVNRHLSDLAGTSKDTLEDDLCWVDEQYEELRATLIVAAGRPFGSSIASLDDEPD